jgi:DNA-binding HxlR family transcriptional regulator
MSYKRKITEDLNCGLVVAMKAFGSKWKPCILDAINKGFHRPSEIHKQIPEASPRVIDMQLRELENDGMVEKEQKAIYPLHTDYFLTETGSSILPLLNAMEKWGLANKNIYQKEPVLAD